MTPVQHQIVNKWVQDKVFVTAERAAYNDVNFKQFIFDMLSAGLEEKLCHYHGRFFYIGPAVTVDSIQDALSETKVKCQWDQLGLGYIVYPK